MAESEEFHVGDTGTDVEFLIQDQGVAVDVSGMDLTDAIYLKHEDAVTKTQDAVFVTDGTDGLIKLVTVVGTFDAEGVWSLQALVAVTGVGSWRSNIIKEKVFPNL